MSSSVGRRTCSCGISRPSNRAVELGDGPRGRHRAERPWRAVLQPAHRRQSLVPPAEARRIAGGDHAAVVDDRDRVGQRLGLLEVVRGQQDGRALRLQRADEVPELAPGLRVEAGRRLVEEQQLRTADDAQRDVEAAALTAGQGAHTGGGLLREAHCRDDLVRVARVREVAGEVPHRLGHRQIGEVRHLLQHDADARPPLAATGLRVDPEHPDIAGLPRFGSPPGSRPSSSCPLRWGRAATRTARSPRSGPARPRLAPDRRS